MKINNDELVAALERQFAFLKKPSELEALMAQSIALSNCKGIIVPVAEVHRGARLLRETFDPGLWLDAPLQVAFLVIASSLEPIAVLGVNANADLELRVSVLGGDVEQAIGNEALATLGKWLSDILYIKSISIDAGISATAAQKAGFDAGVFVSTEARNIGKDMILTAGPSISSRESAYAQDAAKYGWNKQWSKYLTKFEREFATFVGAKHALACSSGTGALTIALTALGIGPGDEVIVPDLTWVATANAVRYVGAIPVFADVELDSWNMDVTSAEKLITPRTKAIMPVHMYGHPARMDGIMRLARSRRLFVVEDAAPAIGAEWNGQRCGSFGDFAAFSFQGAKLLVTGEGGMLVCSNPELYAKAYKIWDQGRNPERAFWIDGHGVKYKMANIQAAIGLGQLERCAELVAMKRRVFSWYTEGLEGTRWVTLNREVPGASSIYWMSSIRLDESAPISRDTLIAELKKRNVDTRPVFPAISQYPIWDRTGDPQPTALRVGRQALNLPSGVCLRREQVLYTCSVIRSLLGA